MTELEVLSSAFFLACLVRWTVTKQGLELEICRVDRELADLKLNRKNFSPLTVYCSKKSFLSEPFSFNK